MSPKEQDNPAEQPELLPPKAFLDYKDDLTPDPPSKKDAPRTVEEALANHNERKRYLIQGGKLKPTKRSRDERTPLYDQLVKERGFDRFPQ